MLCEECLRCLCGVLVWGVVCGTFVCVGGGGCGVCVMCVWFVCMCGCVKDLEGNNVIPI